MQLKLHHLLQCNYLSLDPNLRVNSNLSNRSPTMKSLKSQRSVNAQKSSRTNNPDPLSTSTPAQPQRLKTKQVV